MTIQQSNENRIICNDETRFCRPEVLLLDSFRLWSQSPDNLAYVRRRLREELGPDAAERAAKAIKLLGHIMGLQTRRTFYLMRPGSVGVTPDERALLAMVGAVLHHRRPHANAIAMLLLPVPCHGTVLAVAGELGRAFRMGGLVIAPPRDVVGPPAYCREIRAVA
ncbi:MAG: hypothetical protein JJ900_13645 [Rhodospirillales bacterium]|nr:hypothetical protein [Rhodospirillales bacterium]MBO6787887.1 hypothetical protein [Rhodospirillales bacterium]